MKIKNILLALLGTAMLTGCGDFLDEQPVSEIPGENMWLNARDAKAGVNEIYGMLRTTMRQNYWYWGEFRSDNFAPGAPTSVEQERVIRNQMTTELACTQWTSLYQMINQANLAIKYLPGIDMPSVADRSDLLGQAYAMRALGYLYAVRVWGDVPLFTEPTEKYESGAIYKERSPESTVMALVIADLKKAENLINRTGNLERKRISIFGVWAIMADAYMWLHEYALADQAITNLRTTNTTFMNFESNISTVKKMFQDELNNRASDNTPSTDDYTTKELILVVHFNMDEVGASGYSYMYQWFSGSGNRAAVLSPQYLDIMNQPDQAGDLRKDLYMFSYQDGMELRKFIGETKSSTLNRTCEVAYPIYRYTDMLLMQAECLTQLGKWEEALQLVKMVRDRAGVNTKTSADFLTKEDVLEYIWRERQIELVGEGRRWFDLRRTGQWKTVMEPVSGLKDDGNELFPIYYMHIRENQKLVQNPYYGTTE